MHVSVFPAYMSVYHTWPLCLESLEEGIKPSRTGITRGSSKVQQVLLPFLKSTPEGGWPSRQSTYWWTVTAVENKAVTFRGVLQTTAWKLSKRLSTGNLLRHTQLLWTFRCAFSQFWSESTSFLLVLILTLPSEIGTPLLRVQWAN